MPECGLQSAPPPSPFTPASADPPEAPPRAFPEPARLAAATETELRQAGLGYRAPAVQRLAAAIAAGDLPRDAAIWAASDSDDLYRRLLALAGIGPYAAANLLLLLGHYDRLAIDSWLRRAVRDAWFAGQPITDREIEAAFERFGQWRALVYWFHPTLHPARDAWRQSLE
jgi:N-glycosylase/DNA lyase